MNFHPIVQLPCPTCITLAVCKGKYAIFQDNGYPGTAKGTTAFTLWAYYRCSTIHDYLNIDEPGTDANYIIFKNFFQRSDD